MLYGPDDERAEHNARMTERFKDMRIEDAPPPARGENIRPPWPACAFDGLRPFSAPQAAEQRDDDDTWLSCPDDDLPGDAVSVVEFRTREGKVGEAYDILDFVTDLKAACPAEYTRLSLWMTAADMDPRTHGVLN